MMRIVLLDENMAEETAHVLDAEGTNGAKRTGGHRQNLALGDIGAELGVDGRLQGDEFDDADKVTVLLISNFKSAIYILQKNSIFATEKNLVIQYHLENNGAGGKSVDKPPCTQQLSKKQNKTPTIS